MRSRPSFLPSDALIDVTDWAAEILVKADSAARRFNPDVVIRLARSVSGVEALLAEAPDADDQAIALGSMTLHVESGLEGLVDVEEPHDRLVLRPLGSPPNARGH